MNNYGVTPALLAFIKRFEGCVLHAYHDQAGILTIGWGTTHYTDGKPVQPGDVITQQTADLLLAHDAQRSVNLVNFRVKVPINANMFIALTDFEYNTGGLIISTLLREVNAGDFHTAAEWFAPWNKITVDGKKVECEDLTKRRAAEAQLFLTPIN